MKRESDAVLGVAWAVAAAAFTGGTIIAPFNYWIAAGLAAASLFYVIRAAIISARNAP